MADEGIEFKSSDLPRSFRDGEEPQADAAPASATTDTAAAAMPEAGSDAASSNPSPRSFQSPFAGTVLDGQAHVVEAYKRSRAKLSS